MTEGKTEQTESEYIIEAENVHKIYDTGKVKVHALRGIDLRVKKGEMVAIMGPSGCGKTTLLNCLSGLDDLTEGSVRIEGRLLNNMTDDEKTIYRAKRMGFIFQSFNLLPVLSAVENVELPLLVAGVNPGEARKKALRMLEMVGLGHAEHRPAELSGGQQQRVTIARSLVNNPAIVWADEPTGNLDTKNSREIVDLLIELNRKNNQTFVVVTHDPAVGKRMDRIIRMESGKILDDRPVENETGTGNKIDAGNRIEAENEIVTGNKTGTENGADRGTQTTAPQLTIQEGHKGEEEPVSTQVS